MKQNGSGSNSIGKSSSYEWVTWRALRVYNGYSRIPAQGLNDASFEVFLGGRSGIEPHAVATRIFGKVSPRWREAQGAACQVEFELRACLRVQWVPDSLLSKLPVRHVGSRVST